MGNPATTSFSDTGAATPAAGAPPAANTSASQTISLAWTAVTGASGYNVYRSTASGSYVSPALLGYVGTAAYSDTGAVTPGTGAPPTVNTSGSQTVKLSWSAVADAISYNIYRSTVSGSYSSPALAGNTTALTFADAGAALSTGSAPSSTPSLLMEYLICEA
jgi:hypothetical protein